MDTTQYHGMTRRALIGIAGVLTVFIVTIIVLQSSERTPAPEIPNPFFESEPNTLVGSVTRDRYVRRNIPVDEYKFIAGERSEHLPVDRIALVHIPNHSRIDDVTMNVALTNTASPTVEADAYGYKYSDADASEEIANIRATTFVAQFPGTFWTTAEAMSKHRADFESFAAAKGITWVLGSTVRLDPAGSLHVIVANDPEGDRLTVQRSVCGDGTKEGTETCDDGDTSSGDGCSATCAVESGYECNTSVTPNVCTIIGGGTAAGGGAGSDGSNGGNTSGNSAGTTGGNGGTGGGSSSSVASSSHTDYLCNGQIQSVPCSSSSSSSVAAPVCRNGIREGTEQCDDGNSVDTDACTNECKNGFPVPFGEGGGTASSSSSSRIASSSHSDYACNGQIQSSPCSSSSSSAVAAPICGNGMKEGTETCDDGNTANADGCSSACAIESNFRCTGTPSACQSYLNFVKALADTNQDGTVSDNEALMLLFGVADAPGQSFGSVSQYDIDADGDVDNADVALILAQLDILAPV